MKTISKLFVTLLFIFTVLSLSGINLFCAPACPDITEVTQPDGEKIKAYIRGDEKLNWITDENDRVIENGMDNYWYYSEIKEDKIKSGKEKVKSGFTGDGIKSDDVIKYNKKSKTIKSQYMSSQASSGGYFMDISPSPKKLESTPPIIHNHNSPEDLLVILVEFNNASIQNTAASWSDYFFGASGTTVRTYFNEVSGGKFHFSPAKETYGTDNDGIVKVKLTCDHPNVRTLNDTKHHEVARDALLKADQYVDFSQYDTQNNGFVYLHIMFVYAGYDGSASTMTPSIWAESLLLRPEYGVRLDNKTFNSQFALIGEMHNNNMATIGVGCHELAHSLGAMDLYDYTNRSLGVGRFSLMGNGNWNSVTGIKGSMPCHPDAFTKMILGWVTPVTLSGTDFISLKSTGTSDYNVLKVTSTLDPNEYFLVENRQFRGYDEGLKLWTKNGGIAIWHINDRMANNDDETNKKVDLEEADEGYNGFSHADYFYDIKGDGLFSNCNNTEFGETSIPGSDFSDGTASRIFIRIPGSSSNTMRVTVSKKVSKCSQNGHTYALIDKDMSWDDAKELCEKLGGHLAAITSPEEMTAVRSLAYTRGSLSYYWLGARQYGNTPGGDWRWITGEPTDYTNWLPGQPESTSLNNYAMMIRNRDFNDALNPGKWAGDEYDPADRNCGAICEWDGSYNSSNGHVYAVINKQMTWEDAKIYCEKLGGHLVTISSIEEHNYVNNLSINNNYLDARYWIGYCQPSGSVEPKGGWQWVTGEPVTYENWYSSKPDDSSGANVACMYNTTNSSSVRTVKWDDEINNPETKPRGFICEWEGYVNPQTGHIYRLIDSQRSWNDAKSYCEFLKGHLATITSYEENEFVASSAISGCTNFYWLGLYNNYYTPYGQNYGWNWVTGEFTSYTNWSYFQPDSKFYGRNYCMMAREMDNLSYYVPGKWCDSDMISSAGFICEWDTNPNPLIVDDFSSQEQFASNFNDLNNSIIRGIDNCYYLNDSPGSIVISSSVSSQFFQTNVNKSVWSFRNLALRLKSQTNNGTENHWDIVVNDGTDHSLPLSNYGAVTSAFKDFLIPLKDFSVDLGNIKYIKFVHRDTIYSELHIDDICFN